MYGARRVLQRFGLLAVLVAANAYADEDMSIHLVLQPPQWHLEGPAPFRTDPKPGSWGVSQFLGTPNYLDIASLALAIDTITQVNKFLDLDENEGVDPLTRLGGRFDYEGMVVNGLYRVDQDSDWYINDVSIIDYGKFANRYSRSIFGTFRELDYIVFLDFTYFISPGFDQVRLIVDTRRYRARPNSKLRAENIGARSYEYLSASHGDVLRPWHPGEKEALIDEIESSYADKLARFPHNKAAYDKERKALLAAVSDRDVVLPVTGIAESWTREQLHHEIRLATDHIVAMIRDDLRTIGFRSKRSGKRVTIPGYDRNGKQKKFKGYVVSNNETHTVYQVDGGNLYSAPN